ncbi:amidohydrolase, partial [candidate division KSB1 bacterium]|nr:amidohydrolase [candidate division KSB1 bacterium]
MCVSIYKRIGFLFLIFAISSCGIQPADIIIRNAKIITMNKNKPRAEALAVRGNKIVAVGSNLMIDKYRTNETNVINAQGKLVIPGFIDAHCHFAAG